MAMTDEEFYDTEIAPVITGLMARCSERGMSLLALVEWAGGDTGESYSVRADASIKTTMAAWAMKAHGNADALIMAMQKHAKEHGHNSVCLAMLERNST